MTQFTPSFRLLAEYLQSKDYTVQLLDMMDTTGVYVTAISPRGGRAIMNANHPTYPFVTATGRSIYKDKQKAYNIAAGLGVSIPATLVISGYDETVKAFYSRYKKLIVKPRSGQGSKGLTLNIMDEERLHEAIDKALLESNEALVQQQFIGEEVRFMTINGQVASALLREKPHVIGDGVSTISRLIELENEARQSLNFSIVPYPLLDDKIIDAALIDSQTVPMAGERVELGLGTMIRTGASIYDIYTTMDPSYIAIAEKIAGQFGRGMLAVDIMISDPSQAATPDNYIFLEINGDPALVLCYSCRNGKQFDIVNNYLGPMLVEAIDGERI